MNKYIQTIACQDKPNLIKEICDFIASFHGNIIEMEQHVDKTEGLFFLRVSWETEVKLEPNNMEALFAKHLSTKLHSNNFKDASHKIQIAILVSKMDHCLLELLMRHQNSEWAIEIPMVISNHPDLKTICDRWQIPFTHVPANGDKAKQEQAILKILDKLKIEAIVLARYMQILTSNFVQNYPNRIINIHHSFLPAFIGAKPYHQAHKQGVKMVGATSHYVTDELDKGPIICQDTTPVNHSHEIEDFIHMGKDVEKRVLVDALTAHIEHKIIVINNKTIIFR